MVNKILIVVLVLALPAMYFLGKKVQKEQQVSRTSLLDLNTRVKIIEREMYPFAIQMYEKGLHKGIELSIMESKVPLSERVEFEISKFTKYVNSVQKDTTNQFFYVK